MSMGQRPPRQPYQYSNHEQHLLPSTYDTTAAFSTFLLVEPTENKSGGQRDGRCHPCHDADAATTH